MKLADKEEKNSNLVASENLPDQDTEQNSHLLKKIKKLEAENRDLVNFVTIAYQDLREPLRGINNFSRYLKEDYDHILDEDGKAKLEALIKIASRTDKFIDALLYHSTLSNQEYSASTISLHDVVCAITDEITDSCPEKKIIFEVDSSLPIIRSNRELLNIIFYSLIKNAVIYNESTPVRIHIGVEKVVGSKVTVYVKDNGIGIEESCFDKIFRIFKRLHLRGEYGDRVGVGLSNAKKIIELHDGSIRLESKVGEGTTFYVTLDELQVN